MSPNRHSNIDGFPVYSYVFTLVSVDSLKFFDLQYLLIYLLLVNYVHISSTNDFKMNEMSSWEYQAYNFITNLPINELITALARPHSKP